MIDMNVLIVAGARPNFMKIAPLSKALDCYNWSVCSESGRIGYKIVHTGQHYDSRMSDQFFRELGIPEPDVNLEVGSGSHARQTAAIMERFEGVCLKEQPSHILVVGDVNSTIACALVAAKLGIKVIHVEAGLRSFDRSMPEEINRVLTDAISDFLFTTEEGAGENLLAEGVKPEKIHFVGNVMIDTLLGHRQSAARSDILQKLGLQDNPQGPGYVVLTLHRPSNVDSKAVLEEILQALVQIGDGLPIVFPVHPRTQSCIQKFELDSYFKVFMGQSDATGSMEKGLHAIEPLGYYDFLHLMANARLVLTDSGGIQEETTILGVPCVTLRNNTERPVTLTHGTNVLAGSKKEEIVRHSLAKLKEERCAKIPPLWDGKAAERIVAVLAGYAGG